MGGWQRLLLIGREGVLHLLGSLEQRLFPSLQLVDFGLGDLGFPPGVGGEPHHYDEADQRDKQNQRRERPRKNPVTKRF